VLAPGDGDDNLVEMPLVAALRRTLSDTAGKDLAKFEAPLPDRLVADADLRAANISSTMRRLSGNRKYSQTA
jgi:hypothetical protein